MVKKIKKKVKKATKKTKKVKKTTKKIKKVKKLKKNTKKIAKKKKIVKKSKKTERQIFPTTVTCSYCGKKIMYKDQAVSYYDYTTKSKKIYHFNCQFKAM